MNLARHFLFIKTAKQINSVSHRLDLLLTSITLTQMLFDDSANFGIDVFGQVIADLFKNLFAIHKDLNKHYSLAGKKFYALKSRTVA